MVLCRTWTLAIAVLLLAAAGCASRPDAPPPNARHGEFANEAVAVDGGIRRYRLVVPRTIDLAKPAPLVLAFHGMLVDDKDVMPAYTRLSETAERHRFVLAYPNAAGGAWGLWPRKVVNDIAFFDALLARLSADYRIDPDRIYVLGMSNGGYFAQLLATERSTVIAAAASHSGLLGLQTLGGVNAERKFPVLIVHGTQDWIFSYWFARENADRYRREGHEVKYLEIAGLGHAWAAGINDQIWEFFASHPRTAMGR
jgi:polyhydroxybutyrate depolymerase